MANYNIKGMVPDVVGAIGGGLQAAQGVKYFEDRKRNIEQQERQEQRYRQQQGIQAQQLEQQQERQAMSDFGLIAKNVDRNDPVQIKQALAWAAGRNEPLKRIVWDAIQQGSEASLNLIDMFQAPEKEEVEEAIGQDIPQEKLDYWAEQYNATGKKVFPVRGKRANAINKLIIDRAAELGMEKGESGVETKFLQEDRKAIQRSIGMQEKQRGSMTSFVTNLGMQVDAIKNMASELKTLDTRLLNKPIRWFRRKIAGNPELAKYEVYLGEIQSEIGKLSSGSTASVSELSEGAREKWEGILDENLSINDMIKVLEEVKHAGYIRMESVDDGLRETRQRLRSVGSRATKSAQRDIRIQTAEKRKKGGTKIIRLKYNPETGGFK